MRRIASWPVLSVLFLLEIMAWAIWGYAASQLVGGFFGGVVGFAVFLAVVIGWAAFASPKRRFTNPVSTIAAKVIVFGVAALAIYSGVGVTSAAIFAAVAVIFPVLAWFVDPDGHR